MALRLLGPLDWGVRSLSGRESLPPLWLRRHAGPIRHFESAARDSEMLLRRLDLVARAGHVLEIGCGCGAMVPGFQRLLGSAGSYVGFDVHEPSVRWCQKQFRLDERFRFVHADLASAYSRFSSSRPVESYCFPMADQAADLIVAKSVFTHLLAPAAKHYLEEIRRSLQPRGRALVTAFLFADGTRPPAFPYPEGHLPVRWLRDHRQEAATAFARGYFEGLVAEAGLEIETFVPGYWPGTCAVPMGQDILVLVRAEP